METAQNGARGLLVIVNAPAQWLCQNGPVPVAPALLTFRPRSRAWVVSGNRRHNPPRRPKTGRAADRDRSICSRRESAVLTIRPAEKSSASWRVVRGTVAIVASAMTLTSVYAGGVGNLNCIGGAGSVNCVGQWGPGGDPNIRIVPRLSARRKRRKPRRASANGWHDASPSSGTIVTALRATNMPRAAANTGLAPTKGERDGDSI